MDVHHVWDALIFMKLAVETCWNQHVPTILGGSYRIKPSQTLTSGVQGDRRWKHCPFGPRSERAFGGKEMAQGRGPRVWSLQHDQHSARIYRILGVPLSFCWFYLDVRTFPSFNRVLFGSGNERKLCCVLVPQNTFDRVGSKWCGQRCWPCCELIVPFSISIALEPFFFSFFGVACAQVKHDRRPSNFGAITNHRNHKSWIMIEGHDEISAQMEFPKAAVRFGRFPCKVKAQRIIHLPIDSFVVWQCHWN